MLDKLKKKAIAILDVIEGVKTSSYPVLLMQSDIDQMRRVMMH